MRSGPRADHELLASGDAEDFARFYDRHVSAVTSYVARRTAGPEVVFDLVSETFARALEHRRQFDRERGPAVAWLFGIARNLIMDAARRGRVASASRRRLAMSPVALDDEKLAAIERRGAIDLRAALAHLSELEREAVVRRVLAEQPYPAIAAELGCSEHVVRQRVSRGLASLKRSLEEPE